MKVIEQWQTNKFLIHITAIQTWFFAFKNDPLHNVSFCLQLLLSVMSLGTFVIEYEKHVFPYKASRDDHFVKEYHAHAHVGY